MSSIPALGNAESSLVMVPTVGLPLAQDVRLDTSLAPKSPFARFSSRDFFKIEDDFCASELAERMQSLFNMPAFSRTSFGRESIHDRLVHCIRAADIFYEFGKNAEVVDSEGNHVQTGLSERDLKLGTFAALIHDWKHASWCHQLAEQGHRFGISYDHDLDPTHPKMEKEFRRIIESNGFTVEEVCNVFKKGNALGCVVKAIADRLSYLYLDCYAAGLPADKLNKLAEATEEITKNGVFVLPAGVVSADNVSSGQVGINASARSSVDQIKTAREYVFENAGWRPESLAAWSFVVDATERALKSGSIVSSNQLISVLQQGRDEDIISRLSPFEQDVLSGARIDEVFEPVFALKVSGLKDGKNTALLHDSGALRKFVLEALRCGGVDSVIAEDLVISASTPVHTKDLQYKLYSGSGKMDPYNFRVAVDDEKAVMFVALHLPPEDRESGFTREIARSRLDAAFAPLLKEDADTDIQVFGRPNSDGWS